MICTGHTVTREWRLALALSLALLCFALLVPCLGETLPRARAGNLLQTGVEVQAGQPVTGTIGGDSHRYIYIFAGQEDELISISMSRLSGDLDPLLLLTDSDGAILTLSDDDGDRTDALIELERLPATGRYFIIATRFGQEHGTTTGDFSLLVERMGSGPTADSTLVYGDQVLGRITAQAPLAFYFLRAQRGDVITISMQRTSGNLDPYLDLATPDGIVLLSDDDGMEAQGTLDAAITNYTIPR